MMRDHVIQAVALFCCGVAYALAPPGWWCLLPLAAALAMVIIGRATAVRSVTAQEAAAARGSARLVADYRARVIAAEADRAAALEAERKCLALARGELASAQAELAALRERMAHAAPNGLQEELARRERDHLRETTRMAADIAVLTRDLERAQDRETELSRMITERDRIVADSEDDARTVRAMVADLTDDNQRQAKRLREWQAYHDACAVALGRDGTRDHAADIQRLKAENERLRNALCGEGGRNDG